MIIENKKGGRLNEKVVYKNWLLVCRFYDYCYRLLPFGNVCTDVLKGELKMENFPIHLSEKQIEYGLYLAINYPELFRIEYAHPDIVNRYNEYIKGVSKNEKISGV